MLKLYTTKTCPDCKILKAYLNALNIEFKEILAVNEDTINYIVELTGKRKVPVLVNKNKFVVGFDIDKIKEIIK